MVLEFEEIREKNSIELINSMLREGLTIEKISNITAFPIEKIKKLQEEINKN